MLSLALTFLIVGLVAGLLGLYGVAQVATQIAWVSVPGGCGAPCLPHGPDPAIAASRLTTGNAMKESLLAAIGMWLVFVLVFVSLVGAQTGPPPAPASKPATTKTPAPAQPRSAGRSRASIPLAGRFSSRTGPG